MPTRSGLLTGDSSVNGEAPVVVMTTEVLRNMMYAGSRTLDGLGYVVMDEVHYLADRFRGAVWEEVIIHLPEHVQVVSLSATVSNAEEFGDWLAEVRGDTRGRRLRAPAGTAVPARAGRHDHVRPVRRQPGQPRPAGRHPHRRAARALGRRAAARRLRAGRAPGARAPGRQPPRGRRPGPGGGTGGAGFARGGRPGGGATRAEVIDELDRDGLLPAITFIFSRVGCEAAVSQLLAAGHPPHPRP